MNDYHNKFSPSEYLECCYKHPGDTNNSLHDFAVQRLHTFFNKVQVSPTSQYKVLDYGCGPAVANAISVARVATEVVFAEYTEKNRKAVQQWLDKEPTAWNWRPFFKHVIVTLEGKSPSEALEREEHLRSITRAVVPCDVTQDPPIADGFGGPYDAVICKLSIEAGCPTQEVYKAAVKRVCQLIKPGGSLLLYSVMRPSASTLGCYNVGNETFTEIPLSIEFVHSTLKESKMDILSTECLDLPAVDESAAFFVAKKPC